METAGSQFNFVDAASALYKTFVANRAEATSTGMGATNGGAFAALGAARATIDADMVNAAKAAGFQGNLRDIKASMEEARKIAEDVVRAGGVNGHISDARKKELMSKAVNSVKFQAAASDATRDNIASTVRNKTLGWSAGAGGFAGGVIGVVVGGALKTAAALIGKGDSVNFKAITGVFAAGGAALTATATSPISWVAHKLSGARNADNQTRQAAMEHMVASVIEKAEHSSAKPVAPAVVVPQAVPAQAQAQAQQPVAPTATQAGSRVTTTTTAPLGRVQNKGLDITQSMTVAANAIAEAKAKFGAPAAAAPLASTAPSSVPDAAAPKADFSVKNMAYASVSSKIPAGIPTIKLAGVTYDGAQAFDNKSNVKATEDPNKAANR